jgi:hypothetical protein
MNKLAMIALSTIALSSPALAEPGDVARGERDFRADVIFAAPEEISKMIEPRC